MCIVKVHPHAETVTMLSALEHNAQTLTYETQMLAKTLAARGELDSAARAIEAHTLMRHARDVMLAAYGEYISANNIGPHKRPHSSDDPERTGWGERPSDPAWAETFTEAPRTVDSV